MKSSNTYEQSLYEWCVSLCHLKALASWICSRNSRKGRLACKAHEVIAADRAMQEKWFKDIEERLNYASSKRIDC